MRIFLTGATGFIGAALVAEFQAAGHAVLGLARSEAAAQRLAHAGAAVHRGSLQDLASLRAGAAAADAVVHAAFDHDFSRFAANCDSDRLAIGALGEGLAGSDRPLLVTSVVGMGSGQPGVPASEAVFNAGHPNPRQASELAANALLQRGINVSVLRLPQVHDPLQQGLVTPLIALARRTGVSAYVGDGSQRWSAAHVSDVARLYRLALQAREPGARYHAVAEEGVPLRAIAESIGRGLGLPTRPVAAPEAAAHFGWLALFAAMDMPASSRWTQASLGWQPVGPTLLADLDAARFAGGRLAGAPA